METKLNELRDMRDKLALMIDDIEDAVSRALAPDKHTILDQEWHIANDGYMYNHDGSYIQLDWATLHPYKREIAAAPDAYRALKRVIRNRKERHGALPNTSENNQILDVFNKAGIE